LGYGAETYFSPAYRGWEFMTGGVISQLKQPIGREQRLASTFSALGIALLLVAAVLKFEPGGGQLFQIFLACVGSGLSLRYGAEQTPISRALAWYPISLVGLASYSIYLVHYPLLGAMRHIGYDSTTLSLLFLYLAVVVAVGIVQWQFVEKPSQNWFRKTSFTRSWTLLGATLATAGLIAGAVVLTRGLPSRLNAELAAHYDTGNERRLNARRCPSVPPELVRLGQSCLIGTSQKLSTVVVWGDSHALALAPALERIANANNVAIRGFFRPACPPLLGVRRIGAGQAEPCYEASQAFVEAMEKAPDVETVMIHARWAYWAEGYGFASSERQPAVLANANDQTPSESNNRTLFQAALQRTIVQLRLHGKRVILLGPIPEMPRHLPNELINAGMVNRAAANSVGRTTFNQRQDFVLTVMRQQESYDVQFLEPHDILCSGNKCLGVSDGAALYYDDNHLSQAGAIVLQPMLATRVFGRRW
jgi:hypothetical protein